MSLALSLNKSPVTKQISPSVAGSHSYPPTLQRRQQLERRQKGKERGKWRETGMEGWAGGCSTTTTTTVLGVSFDEAPLQHLHIFKSGNEYHARGANKDKPMGGLRPCCGLRSSRRYPSSTLGETQGSGVGTGRPPELSGGRGATCSLQWISILFVSIFLSNFCPSTSATDG